MTYNKLLACLICVLTLLPFAGADARKYTLVIDAGHGGKDAGACGARSKEKTLTLRYALAFGQMVEHSCPDVKVIYTRKTDRFLELWQRAEIANTNKADLFISVHINALPKGHTARGFQTYTLGHGRHTGKQDIIENLEVAKRENSVILKEANYKQRYGGYDPNSPETDIFFEFVQEDNMVNSIELAKLMQKHVCSATGRQNQGAHQDNLAVLRLTSMPGCLLELGFISTPDEEQFLNAESSTQKYARGMFNAFQAYRRLTDKGVPVVTPKEEPAPGAATNDPKADKEEPVKKETPAKADSARKKEETVQKKEPETKEKRDREDPSAPVFKVQLTTSSKKLKAGAPELKGIKNVDSYKENNTWKYTVGASTDYNAIYKLRKEVLPKFPEAFIIAFRNGEKMNAAEAYKEFKAKKK